MKKNNTKSEILTLGCNCGPRTCHGVTTTEDINNLYNALKNYRQKPFKLLVWNGSSLDKEKLDKNIAVFFEKGPEQDGMGVWDKTRVIPQEEIDYKNKMKQFIIDNIKECGFEPKYYSLSLKDRIKFYIKWTLPKMFSITNNWVDYYKVLTLFGLKIRLWKLPKD